MLTQFLKQPFPFFENKRQIVVIVTLCVFLVLIIVQSFFFDQISLGSLVLFVGGFTLISALCSSFIVYLLPVWFKRFFDEKRWTKGKYFIFTMIHCLIIGTVNTMYNYFILSKFHYYEIPFYKSLFINLVVASLVGIIPTVSGYFWIRFITLRSDLQEIEDQNRKLFSRVYEKNIPDKMITLSGNTKESLTLFPRELLYMESLSNYIHVYYKIDDRILHKKLRATLLQMEQLLSDYPFLMRCHRAFIVNIFQIESIKGLKLRIKSMETEIPVSKTNKTDIQNQLKKAGCLSQI